MNEFTLVYIIKIKLKISKITYKEKKFIKFLFEMLFPIKYDNMYSSVTKWFINQNEFFPLVKDLCYNMACVLLFVEQDMYVNKICMYDLSNTVNLMLGVFIFNKTWCCYMMDFRITLYHLQHIILFNHFPPVPIQHQTKKS